VSSVQI